jgi:hypothetical protein
MSQRNAHSNNHLGELRLLLEGHKNITVTAVAKRIGARLADVSGILGTEVGGNPCTIRNTV